MNLKDFIRPTNTKIVVMLLLFITLPTPYRVLVVGGPNECDGQVSCRLGYETRFMPYSGWYLLFPAPSGGNQAFQSMADYAWKIPYLLVVPYFISCAAALIIDVVKKDLKKIRKKKKPAGAKKKR